MMDHIHSKRMWQQAVGNLFATAAAAANPFRAAAAVIVNVVFVFRRCVPIDSFECVLIQHLLIFPFLMSYTFDLIYYLLRPFLPARPHSTHTHTYTIHYSLSTFAQALGSIHCEPTCR